MNDDTPLIGLLLLLLAVFVVCMVLDWRQSVSAPAATAAPIVQPEVPLSIQENAQRWRHMPGADE